MPLTYLYSRDRDIWCIVHYGKSSVNAPTPTKVFQELTATYGESPSKENTSLFIDNYLTQKQKNVEEIVRTFQKEWDTIASTYHTRAEEVFGITLPHDIVAYLSTNTRCPYNINDNLFFVSIFSVSSVKTAMHELWHFYTWYKYGVKWEEKLGGDRYNDIKESLTVLLNLEFKDLLPPGVEDTGYPQHKELREKIVGLWSKDKNIDSLWNTLTSPQP